MDLKKDTKEIFPGGFLTRITLIYKAIKILLPPVLLYNHICYLFYFLLNMNSFRFTNVRQWSKPCVMIYLSVKINLNWLSISEAICILGHFWLRSVLAQRLFKLWEMSCHRNNYVRNFSWGKKKTLRLTYIYICIFKRSLCNVWCH